MYFITYYLSIIYKSGYDLIFIAIYLFQAKTIFNALQSDFIVIEYSFPIFA